ncbi:MAG TPA: TonB-dependent receptor [Pyrinomonadaceae bacterium]|nr:TonB-dependent receptor [Pyrinomonadaceae bacterium]
MTRHSSPNLALLALLFFVLGALPFAAHAQSATATLSGTVLDPNGAVIPGATITVTNSATGLSRETTTNDEGHFTVPLLPPSSYSVTARREGFYVLMIPNIVLNVGDEKSLKIELKVGDVKETVNVTGETPLISESPAVGTVVDRQFVENVPLNGRSFQSLITSVPGVVVVPGAVTGRQGEFSINGQRTEANYYTVDGVSANTGNIVGTAGAFGASGSVPEVTALGTTQSIVSLDALQEFRIQTSSYSAEYGRTPGGQISFVTRSGTNDLHGSAFDYLRNGVFDANNWFNNANRLVKTSERQNDFGATLGGPIVIPHVYRGRGRTFFFFSYEGLRLSIPQSPPISFVPDRCVRGVAGACTGTDQPATLPLQPFLNAFPLPTGPALLNAAGATTGLAQFATAFSVPGSLNSTSIRIDHMLRNNFTIFGRYSDAPSNSVARGGSPLPYSDVTTSYNVVRSLTMGATNVFTSRLTNELRFNNTWNTSRAKISVDNFGGAVPLELKDIKDTTGQSTPQIESLNVALSLGSLTQLSIADRNTSQHQVNFTDTLSYSLGRHSLKFGIDYRHLDTPMTLAKLSVTPIFTSKAQLQSGSPSSGNISSQASIPIEPIYYNVSLFAQDEWKVTPRLNLSLGLRWELNPPPDDAFGNLPYTLDQTANLKTAVVAPKGTPLWRTTHNNFAPRVGAVYHLFRKAGRETIVRGGFGVYYDLGNTYASTGYLSVGITASKTLTATPFPFTSTQLALPAPSVTAPYAGSVTAFDENLRLPYTLEWNAAIEQALGKSQTLTISYVGSAGRRLLLQRIARPATLGNTNFTATGSLNLITNRPTSDYDAMQLQYQRRLKRGFQANASYTWSHSIDEASVNGAVVQLLRASSNFDIRHNFQLAATYDLPGKYDSALARAILAHWALEARVMARSALPFDVLGGSTFDAAGLQQQVRANLVAGQPIYIDDQTAPGGRRVNFSAFTIPTAAQQAAGQYGDAPRNFLRAFPASQVDFGIRREFPLYEKVKLQFRAEAFNLFNHPNFGGVANVLASGATLFGRANNTLNNQLGGLNALYQQGGPRSFQFALKIVF